MTFLWTVSARAEDKLWLVRDGRVRCTIVRGEEDDFAGDRSMPYAPTSPGTGASVDYGPTDITGRPIANDLRFELAWILKVAGDGLPESQQKARDDQLR